MTLEIHPSAHKHGVRDADIVHAMTYALFRGATVDDKILYLGPDTSGNLLEVLTVTREGTIEMVIHAMKMRRSYRGSLPGGARNGR